MIQNVNYFSCTQTKGSFFVSPNIPGVNIYIEEYSKDSFNFLCAAASVCPCYWDDTGLLIWIWLFDIYVIAEINTLTEWLSTALKNQTIRTFEKQEERVVNLRASARPVPVYSSNFYYCSRIK